MIPLDEFELNSIGKPVIFQQDIIITIFEIIRGAWIYVRKIPDFLITKDEETLAGALYHEMWAEKKRRGIPDCQPPGIENESAQRISNKSLKPDGFIDFKFTYGWGQETYFGIECKLVSSSSNGKYERLAREYITEGIQRFVDGKYCLGHPFVSMLGFVIDGTKEDSIQKICKLLNQNKYKNKVLLKENWTQETNFGNYTDLYRTIHEQTNHNYLINILHLFLEI